MNAVLFDVALTAYILAAVAAVAAVGSFVGRREQLGITVVGYLRQDSLNLYAGDALDLG